VITGSYSNIPTDNATDNAGIMDYTIHDRHRVPTLRWTSTHPDPPSAELFRTSVDHLSQVCLSHFRISAIEILALKRTSDEHARATLVITIHPDEAHRENELQAFAIQQRFIELVTVKEVIIGVGLVERHRRKIRNGDSISAYADLRSQGSFGGVIAIGNQLYGTTCYHVMDPSQCTEDIATVPEQSLLPFTIYSHQITKATPAPQDARNDLLKVEGG